MSPIRLSKYLKDTGESRTTFYNLREEGFLQEGVHFYFDVKKRIWVNPEAMAAWAQGKRPPAISQRA